MASTSTSTGQPPRPRPVYVKAVGPRLRILLFFVFGLVALLTANSVYLGSITALEYLTAEVYQDHFYQYMMLAHLALGLLLIVPFILFGCIHLFNARNRKNRRAVRVGYALFIASIAVLVSGVALMRVEGFDLRQPLARTTVYWLHVACPIAAGWLYWLHRLAGPRIKWKIGVPYGVAVAVVVLAMVGLHSQDPRKWNQKGPEDPNKYFSPSLTGTTSGKFISPTALMMDQYCQKCHADIYDGWFHSVHHFSSFNNPAYLAAVRETREVAQKRDGNVQASRWCAGCHDPVPFLSGAFDNPKFDDVKDPTAQAGITCTVCHAMTHVDSTKGNGDYTIEEPLHYPFAYSDNDILQYINNQLVKAKPAFHKKQFLKPFHKSADFCSTCHKVHLPFALNKYKEFLRGQNHHDSFMLSGVSGHGSRSFYYPPKAIQNCSGCHMPLKPSNDFGAKFFADATELSIHDHLFPAANTAIAWFRNEPEIIKAHQQFLADKLRVDIFGLREGGTVDGTLMAPLRPNLPELKPGGKYLLETVIRTLKMGHEFTQGTVDSNEVWLDIEVTSGGRTIGRNGAVDKSGEVDQWAHFVNVYMLDKQGNRINRRNPQDIFVPLYNHQIPPGAGQAVHYGLELPEDLSAPVTITARLLYRKFDKEYTDFIAKSAKEGDLPIRGLVQGEPYQNELPITILAADQVTLPVEGVAEQPKSDEKVPPEWERWNDYGIGLLLEGLAAGGKGELRQASEAFGAVERLGRYDGPLNLARVYFAEGRLDEATEAIQRAAKHADPPAPPWTIAWLSGIVNKQQGHLDEAIENFESILDRPTKETQDRLFDFSLDYVAINELGQTLFERAKQERGESRADSRKALLAQAVARFEKTLTIDSENVMAHHNLSLLYGQLGDATKADEHRKLHARYKPDETAAGLAIKNARAMDKAADHAAEKLVIYSLHREGAPGLPITETAGAASSPAGGGE